MGTEYNVARGAVLGGGRGEQPARLYLSLSLWVGECVVLNDSQVIGPFAWGRPGGFIDEPAGLQYG